MNPWADILLFLPGVHTDWPKVKYTVADAAITPVADEPGTFTAMLPRPDGMVTGWVNLIDDPGLAVSSRLLPPAAE
ncbi:hypothetical protein EBU58_09800 [bacterium]|nr:hypothetical protein [bacterium]